MLRVIWDKLWSLSCKAFKLWSYAVGILVIAIIIASLLPADKKLQPSVSVDERVTAIYNNLLLHTGEQIYPPLVIINSGDINAWTDGEHVAITTGLIDATSNDDEIAMVLSHELSHVLLMHPTNMVVDPVNAEAQADKLGGFIMLKSGYDICKGRSMFKILQKIESDCAKCTSHPGDAYRYSELSMPWCEK